jgi:hypothetical protein
MTGQPELIATPGDPDERRKSIHAEAEDTMTHLPITPSVFGIDTPLYPRPSIDVSPVQHGDQRYSTVPSFVNDFPTPPVQSAMS